MSISADKIKELRDRTQAGMMECKRALTTANGDIDKAVEILRSSGIIRAESKSARVAADGTVVVLISPTAKAGVLVEINCETDFVAKGEQFQQFAKEVAERALKEAIPTLEALQQSFEAERKTLVAALGENLTIRRYQLLSEKEGVIGGYGHGDARGTRIGVMVAMKKGEVALARDLAMQVAAMRPQYLNKEAIPQEQLEKEKRIFETQTREEGKPEAMLSKIAEGKLNKWASEVTLMGQAYVKDPQKTIEKLLKETDAEVRTFVRFEVGEGVEKQVTDFRAEVMAQVRGNE